MECVIFCLMAFSAAQVVSAFGAGGSFEDVAYFPGFKSIDQMYVIAYSLRKNIEATQKATTKTGITSECVTNCFTDSDYFHFLQSHVHPRRDPCQECHERTIATKDVKLKRTCCVDLIAQIQWQAKLSLNKAKKCIAECKSTPSIRKPKHPNTDKKKQKNKNQYVPAY